MIYSGHTYLVITITMIALNWYLWINMMPLGRCIAQLLMTFEQWHVLFSSVFHWISLCIFLFFASLV